MVFPEAEPMLALTPRDHDILDTLTLRVRVLTLDQVVRTWWTGYAHGRQSALRRLRELECEGKIDLFEMLAHPELPLVAPVVAWRPRDPEPDFDKVAYRLAVRWNLPPVWHVALIASRKMGLHYGGWGGRHPRPTERTHDLHMAALYLLKRAANPAVQLHWKSEEKLREQRKGENRAGKQHLPDAIVTRPKRTAVEFGGAYKVDKLRSFHYYCQRIGLPYEMW